MEAAPAPTKRISVGDVVGETFSTYGQNLGAVLGASIVVFVIVGLVSGLLQSAGGLVLGLLAGIVRLVGYALYTGFVVRLVQDTRDGRRDQTVGDLFSSATGAIVPLIIFGILFGFAVGIGFILLIIPGLILLTFWCVGAPAIVVEREGPIGAFGRSWNLVRGDAWSVFAALLVILIIVVVIQFILGAIATPISDGAIIVASIISTIITAPIFAIAVSVMFFDLGGGHGAAARAASEPPPPAAPAAGPTG
ncbi:MAG TPA: hypothetical protein VK920_10125 [Solirubrobacterales bacterium]|nr:hypothetical protein [Solirubrobacterales bacterium]